MKKQNQNLMDRLQSLQNDAAETELRNSELEGQLRQNHQVRFIECGF